MDISMLKLFKTTQEIFNRNINNFKTEQLSYNITNDSNICSGNTTTIKSMEI
jgi:hypothetical protein